MLRGVTRKATTPLGLSSTKTSTDGDERHRGHQQEADREEAQRSSYRRIGEDLDPKQAPNQDQAGAA